MPLKAPPIHQRGIFTEAVTSLILENIKKGVPLVHACSAAGVHPSTLTKWQQHGERALAAEAQGIPVSERDYPYAKFTLDLAAAKSEAVAERIAHIAEAGRKGAWQADAWWLERQIPQEFGRIDRHELTGKDGGAIQVSQAEIVNEARRIVQESMTQAELPSGD